MGREYAWSWADYEREKARARASVAEQTAAQQPQGRPPARSDSEDQPRGCVGEAKTGIEQEVAKPTARAASKRQHRSAAETSQTYQTGLLRGEVSPFMEPGNAGEPRTFSRIDLIDAPSGMEAQAGRWETEPDQARLRADKVLTKGFVLCRCGGRGKVPGPVPAWFGDKCIEGDCELRAANRLRSSRKGDRPPAAIARIDRADARAGAKNV